MYNKATCSYGGGSGNLGVVKLWTQEEELYLQEHWGSKSVALISKHLERSYDAVRRKADELGLLVPTLHYDGITVQQLSLVLGVSSRTTKSWMENYHFPAKQKIFSKKRRIFVISYDDFWIWTEEHKHLVDISKLEYLILGKEPEWVKEKRIIDKKKFLERRLWSDSDKSRLISLVESYRYTYPEIAAMLKRPEASIKRKLLDLQIKARPLSLDKCVKYTQEELLMILTLLKKGYSFNAITDTLNETQPRTRHKSASGIRGKLERMGFTFHGDMPITYPEEYKKL
jgi:hypothetical protein